MYIGGRQIRARFNLMEHEDVLSMVSYSFEGTYEDYNLAERLIHCECSEDSLPSKAQEQLNLKKPERLKSLR